MTPRRIVVVGDVMLDVVVRPEAPIALTSDTPSAIHLGRGGSGANLAVALAALGHDVTYVGAAGDDVGQRTFVEDLARHGVRCELMHAPVSTGVVVSMVDADGQRAMLSDRGANRALEVSFVLECLRAPFDHLHVSGYTLLDDATRDVARTALDAARAHEASTSVDVCSSAPLHALGAAAFLAASEGVNWLFANEEEALELGTHTDLEAALTRLTQRFDEVLVTRGRHGAVVGAGASRTNVAALGRSVLDTTGAGDAASGTYLGARLDGRRIEESLDVAMRAAALVVGVLGASS